MTLYPMLRGALGMLPEPLRWRTRNAIALGRWLADRAGGHRAGAYEESFWDLHRGGDWAALAEVILRFCSPTSIVDVGCGDGKLLAAIRVRSPALPLLGIDSASVALARAAATGVPVEAHDLASRRIRAVKPLRARIAAFDLAVSLETAEHLPPWTGAAFVETLTHARRIVFSAAQPGQGGTLHMNERPTAYWRARFEERGYRLADFDLAMRDAIAALDLPWWYAANIHVFEGA